MWNLQRLSAEPITKFAIDFCDILLLHYIFSASCGLIMNDILILIYKTKSKKIDNMKKVLSLQMEMSIKWQGLKKI